MKVSPRQQRLLLDIQELDHALARCARKRATIVERETLVGVAGERDRARETFMSAQRELDSVRAELQRVEDDAATVAARRTRDEQLLAASTSSKEALALQAELDTLIRRSAELDDRQLELMEQAEQKDSVFRAAQDQLNGVLQRGSELQRVIADRENECDAERDRLMRQREGIAAEIQGDVKALYEELRARLGMGAARLRGTVSEASNMALTPAELSDILATPADELVFCPSTGVILVRGEDAVHS